MREGLSGPVSAEQVQTLDAVKDASEQLLSLIADLLELTALKRGGVEAMAVEVDPRIPLHDAIAAAKGRRQGVELEVNEPDIVPMMKTDRRSVARALTALINNAFKFTREGKVTVSVEVVGERVLYSIADTGIGIPHDAQRLVFEEFRQVDGTATREFGGSGLGLALARRLARLVHGDISLTSAPGAGSTFRLDVPLSM
jgi:signal transduction histidine kinase